MINGNVSDILVSLNYVNSLVKLSELTGLLF